MTIDAGFPRRCMMGAIVWWLFRQTINVQPWQAQARGPDVHAAALARPAARRRLWVFLGVATSLFALFISAYAMRLDFARLDAAAPAAAADG